MPVPSPPDDRTPSADEFRALYEAQVAYVHRTLRRIGVHAKDLEDLAHEVFIVVYRRLADYDRGRPIKPWLFGIAYRIAADHRRLARHHLEVVGDRLDQMEHAAPGPEEALAVSRDRDLVLRALETLPLEQRAVFIACEIDGHTAPDVARALGVPLNTVYSRVRLARERFAEAVRRLGRGGAR